MTTGELLDARDATFPEGEARRGPVALLARALLLAAIPLALWWYPLGVIPAAGNVAASDAALVALWPLVAWRLLVTGGAASAALAPLAIMLLTVLMGLLAGIGAELSGSGIHGTYEFALFMKRFGLASILPVAALLFRSPGMSAWTRGVSAAALGAQALFTLVPSLQAHLVRPEDWDASVFGDRATGLVTNPNELAYTAVALLLLHAAMLPRHPRLLDRVLLLGAIVATGVCVVASASRSGLLGAGAALVYAMLSRRIHLWTRVAVVGFVAAFVAVGLASTAVFEERVSRAYAQGSSEENIASRLDLQGIALRASFANPLGVGYTGFEDAGATVSRKYALLGSDSLYVDTLLAAGFAGLLALLGLVFAGWVHVGRAAGPDERGARLLRAGLVAFLVFGTAAVVPISVASAPLFFSLLGAASFFGHREHADG